MSFGEVEGGTYFDMWKFITEPYQKQELLTIVIVRVKSLINSQQWESRHGGFCASKVLSSIHTGV